MKLKKLEMEARDSDDGRSSALIFDERGRTHILYCFYIVMRDRTSFYYSIQDGRGGYVKLNREELKYLLTDKEFIVRE